MKKLFLIFILILTGCNNYNDIKNLAIINEIAIDYNKQYIIQIKVLSNDQENKDQIYKETCISINECFNNLNNKLSKKIYLTHLELLIISDSINQNQFKEIINFFLQEQSSRNNFAIIGINNINNNILRVNSKDIINMLDLSINSNGIVKKINFEEIIKDILNFNLSYIPYIDSSKKEIIGYLQIYDNTKKLSKEESIALNFIFNNTKSITLLINNKTYKIENCNTTITPKGNLNINISCNYQGIKKEKEIIENYINNIIKLFIINNKNNYFNYLKEKYNINKDKEIIINTKISLIKTNTGDSFE